jgi:hypothetical protein
VRNAVQAEPEGEPASVTLSLRLCIGNRVGGAPLSSIMGNLQNGKGFVEGGPGKNSPGVRRLYRGMPRSQREGPKTAPIRGFLYFAL